MKTTLTLLLIVFALLHSQKSAAQIDLEHLDYKSILGKVMYVKKGFAPKFSLGKTPIPDLSKVEDVLSLKRNNQINKLYSTFKTGRTIYKVASYAGGALAVYGLARKIGTTDSTVNYKGALASGLITIGSGLLVKFLTKSAAYKAVDIFNGIAVKKIIDIFSIAPASQNMGLGLYVKL